MPLYLLVIALLAQPAAAERVHRQIADVLAAVLSSMEPDDDTALVLGRGFDATARSALHALMPRLDKPRERPGSFPVPRDTIVIDSVVVSDSTAVVCLTAGPVPAATVWICGQSLTVPLRRADEWQVSEAEIRVKCAAKGPAGLSLEREILLEAARLAFTVIELDHNVRVVAGGKLSREARMALSAIAEVPAASEFETESMVIPPNTFAVSRLGFEQNVVHFEGTLGPVPRNGHGCGSNWTMRVRQHANGWSIEDMKSMVC